MSNSAPKIERVTCRRADGTTVEVIVPTTPQDVEQQTNVPAYALATVALSPVIHGRHVWSQFTRDTMQRLERQFGDEVLRKTLSTLLYEMCCGLKPTNPIGLFIHRVRLTPTESAVI